MRSDELSRFPIFKGLNPAQRVELAPLFSPVTFREGETIFAQGTPAERVYVLEAGAVALQFQPEDDKRLTVATLRQESVFGWSAILGRPYYTTSAVCLAPSQAITVPGKKLRALIRSQPELSIILGRMALEVADRQTGALSQIISLINAEMTYAPT
jgi:CRP/FNR family cyclic AMP-dependent transcriptional regulator